MNKTTPEDHTRRHTTPREQCHGWAVFSLLRIDSCGSEPTINLNLNFQKQAAKQDLQPRSAFGLPAHQTETWLNDRSLCLLSYCCSCSRWRGRLQAQRQTQSFDQTTGQGGLSVCPINTTSVQTRSMQRSESGLKVVWKACVWTGVWKEENTSQYNASVHHVWIGREEKQTKGDIFNTS